MEHIYLPKNSKLNISVLAGFFNNVSASYKFVYFLSILEILKEAGFENGRIHLKSIEKEMLKIAWYPHTFYKLRFGASDQQGNVLDDLSKSNKLDDELPSESLDAEIEKYLANNKTTLVNMVPFRLINHFVQGPEYDKTKDIDVVRYTMECAESRPLYSFSKETTSNDNEIIIHPDWLEYLKTHYRIVKEFTCWEWLKYMQKRNPNSMNLADKLFPPDLRNPLTGPTRYWEYQIGKADLRCIYTGEKLVLENLSIDHFLPWSFLAHDQEWNLIPVDKNINSAKGNKLPSKEKYFERFVEMQYRAILAGLPENIKKEYYDSYLLDLGIPDISNISEQAFLEKYEQLYSPLYSIAENQGFSGGWEWRG